MKFTSILAGVFATVAVAAPAEKRSQNNKANLDLSALQNNGFDLSQFNNLQFGSNLGQYLFNLNADQFNLNDLLLLSVNNGLNLGGFESLFQNNNDLFNLQNLVEFSNLFMLAQVASLGVFQEFALQNLNFQQLQFGALQSAFSGFDANSLINSQLQAAIEPVLTEAVVVL